MLFLCLGDHGAMLLISQCVLCLPLCILVIHFLLVEDVAANIYHITHHTNTSEPRKMIIAA